MSYEDGLISTCDIGRNDGSHKGERGAPEPTYPIIFQAVPCRIVPATGKEKDRFPQRDSTITHRVLLPPGTRLDNSHRLFHTDPVTSIVRALQVLVAYEPHQMGVTYVALCEEVPT